jgi:hypothetical protein
MSSWHIVSQFDTVVKNINAWSSNTSYVKGLLVTDFNKVGGGGVVGQKVVSRPSATTSKSAKGKKVGDCM